jgi:hypothetical protein
MKNSAKTPPIIWQTSGLLMSLIAVNKKSSGTPPSDHKFAIEGCQVWRFDERQGYHTNLAMCSGYSRGNTETIPPSHPT